MAVSKSRFAFSLSLAVVASAVGCAADDAGTAQAENEAEAPQTYEVIAEDVEKALADLSPDDRELARAQKTCPVSDELLGSMDTPVKLTVEGRDVFICCRGCDTELLSDPEAYLAKLDETE